VTQTSCCGTANLLITLGDEWVKRKFDTGKYKSGEIYGRPTDPVLLREFEEFIKQKPVKKPN
jgi:hypothetical protein